MSLEPLIFRHVSPVRADPSSHVVEVIETTGVTIIETEHAPASDEPVPFASTLPRVSLESLVSGRAAKTA